MAFDQWSAAQRITSGRLAAMTPKYSPWTPAWSTSSGAALPVYGNAVISCYWSQSGDRVTADFYVKLGSSTNMNGGTASDNWRWGLPVPAARVGAFAGWFCAFPSTPQATPLIARLATTTDFELQVAGGWPQITTAAASGVIDRVTPRTWAANDELAGTLMYEAA